MTCPQTLKHSRGKGAGHFLFSSKTSKLMNQQHNCRNGFRGCFFCVSFRLFFTRTWNTRKAQSFQSFAGLNCLPPLTAAPYPITEGLFCPSEKDQACFETQNGWSNYSTSNVFKVGTSSTTVRTQQPNIQICPRHHHTLF